MEREVTTPQMPNLSALTALRAKVIERPNEASASATAVRQTNGELLRIIRSAKSAAERDRAAETLRRQIKSLCAAIIDRYTAVLTAQEAEDVTQEVLIRLIASQAGTESKTAPEPTPAYIARIATNLLIDQRRFLDRRGLARPGISVDDPETSMSIPDPRLDVEEDVVTRFHRAQVREAVKKLLSPLEAKIVWTRSDGASHGEIAEALGIKEANARKHHERGLKRLRKLAETGQFPVAA